MAANKAKVRAGGSHLRQRAPFFNIIVEVLYQAGFSFNISALRIIARPEGDGLQIHSVMA